MLTLPMISQLILPRELPGPIARTSRRRTPVLSRPFLARFGITFQISRTRNGLAAAAVPADESVLGVRD